MRSVPDSRGKGIMFLGLSVCCVCSDGSRYHDISSVFFVNDDENDDENDENILNYRRRD